MIKPALNRLASRSRKKECSQLDENACYTAFEILDSPEEKKAPKTTDGGFSAYRVLVAAIICETVIGGLPLAFGVFGDYYSTQVNLSSGDKASWIGVLGVAAPFLWTPLINQVCEKSHLLRRCFLWLGWIIAMGSLVAASFCNSFLPLAATQGLLYGIGVVMCEATSLLMINDWFIERRGFAYGIMFAFADLSGVGYGFLANVLLQSYGLRVTFLIFAVGIFVLVGPAIWVLQRPAYAERPQKEEREEISVPSSPVPKFALSPQLPKRETFVISETPEPSPPTSVTPYYRRWDFYLLISSNLVYSFAFYLPFIYLPTFATSLGYSTHQGTIILAVANGCQIIGEVSFGKLSDHINVHVLVTAASLVSSLSVFIGWGFAQSFAGLLIFASMFGTFASGYLALWARIGMLWQGPAGEDCTPRIFGMLSLGRGIAGVASGPISTALLTVVPASTINTYGADGFIKGKFTAVIIFVGGAMALSAILGMMGLIVSVVTEAKERKRQHEGFKEKEQEGDDSVLTV